MKVLIKGAGDLASGIACRLFRCGFDIVMTEIAVPTTVRRTVAFSSAVYETESLVEDVTGVLCNNLAEINATVEKNQIAIMVDEGCQILQKWKPDVVVDGIIAKKNLGTHIKDADTVIGIGPGFYAGIDCHCVVETKRGHDLGRCIWSGSAIPNTGVPGMIGGYARERIIRASAHGLFHSRVQIGDIVTKGDIVAYVDEVPVVAQINGMVRGLLQDLVQVSEGMKAGDIDPRGEQANYETISDKANAIAGGVIEAILFRKRNRMTIREQ